MERYRTLLSDISLLAVAEKTLAECSIKKLENYWKIKSQSFDTFRGFDFAFHLSHPVKQETVKYDKHINTDKR